MWKMKQLSLTAMSAGSLLSLLSASEAVSQVRYNVGVNCPAGSSLQSDGTCLMGNVSRTHAGFSAQQQNRNCPTGTRYHSDGTCLQVGSSNRHLGQSRNSSRISYSNSQRIPCPPGTTSQSDGSCLIANRFHAGRTSGIWTGQHVPNYRITPACQFELGGCQPQGIPLSPQMAPQQGLVPASRSQSPVIIHHYYFGG